MPSRQNNECLALENVIYTVSPWHLQGFVLSVAKHMNGTAFMYSVTQYFYKTYAHLPVHFKSFQTV